MLLRSLSFLSQCVSEIGPPRWIQGVDVYICTNNGWMFRMELITQLGRAHGLIIMASLLRLLSGSHKPFIHSFIRSIC